MLIHPHAAADLVAPGPARCAAALSISSPQESGSGQTGGDGHSSKRQSAFTAAWHGQACGGPVEGLDDEFRDWIIDFGDSGYVARYRPNAEKVIVLAVRHQKEVWF